MGVKGGSRGRERQREEENREAEIGHDHVERGGGAESPRRAERREVRVPRDKRGKRERRG